MKNDLVYNSRMTDQFEIEIPDLYINKDWP